MKIKVHPMFWVFGLVLIMAGRYVEFPMSMICVIGHEWAHAMAARRRGYRLGRLVLMPYGAVLEGGEGLRREDAVPIALAGPMLNFFFVLFCGALWWWFPGTYPYTALFCKLNLALGVFNLLPAYPLDGARIVLALTRKKENALKGLRVAGVALGGVLFALFIASAFFEIQMTLGVIGIMLFLSATEGTKSERYYQIASRFFQKEKGYPLPVRTYRLDPSVPLLRLLPTMKNEEISRYLLNGRELGEEEIGALCVKYPLRTPIGACLDPTPLSEEEERGKGKGSGEEREAGGGKRGRRGGKIRRDPCKKAKISPRARG